MIAALLTALFITFSGGPWYGKQLERSVADVRQKAEEAINQHDRREQVLQHLDEIEKATKEYNKKMSETSSAISKLIKQHAATRDKLNKMFDSLAGSRRDFLQKAIDQRFQMKELMSRAEWEQTFK